MIGNTLGNIEYFNPLQIGGLKLWLDATDPAANGTQPSNASAISSWVDKSGSGNTVTQGTGASQPTYRTNVLNGKPVVRFDGTNDLMQKTSATALANTNLIYFAGILNDNGSGRGTIFDYSNNTITNTGINLLLEAGGGIHYQAGFFDGVLDIAMSTTITLPTSIVGYVYNDGTNAFIFINGVQVATVAAGNIVNTGTRTYTIGSLFGALATYFLNGDMGEILAYNSSQTAAIRLLINRSLGNKWGIAQP